MLAQTDVQDNQLVIGGIPATKLADQFATPLQVYDVAKIRHKSMLFNEYSLRTGLSMPLVMPVRRLLVSRCISSWLRNMFTLT